MLKTSLVATAAILTAPIIVAESAPAEGHYVRLVDALDEPEFYCFDIAGWGDHLQLDDPLQTHTCKPENSEDQMFKFEDGQLKVSEYDRCVQVAGSGGATLPGSAVLARECSDSPLQVFALSDDGLIRIGDTDYCLGAGPDSTPASGPSHIWRTLSVINCDTAPTRLATWQTSLD